MLAFEIAMLVIAYILGWVMTLIGLPGTWLIVVASMVYACFVRTDSVVSIGWLVVLLLLALAVAGEIMETAAGAMGAKQAGGSRRGMLLAIVGSMIGAIIGAGVGLPIPLIGSVIGAIAGAAIGAFAGATVGETWKGRQLGHSLRIGEAAFWGRLTGTVAKLAIASAMVVVGIVALLV